MKKKKHQLFNSCPGSTAHTHAVLQYSFHVFVSVWIEQNLNFSIWLKLLCCNSWKASGLPTRFVQIFSCKPEEIACTKPWNLQSVIWCQRVFQVTITFIFLYERNSYCSNLNRAQGEQSNAVIHLDTETSHPFSSTGTAAQHHRWKRANSGNVERREGERGERRGALKSTKTFSCLSVTGCDINSSRWLTPPALIHFFIPQPVKLLILDSTLFLMTRKKYRDFYFHQLSLHSMCSSASLPDSCSAHYGMLFCIFDSFLLQAISLKCTL